MRLPCLRRAGLFVLVTLAGFTLLWPTIARLPRVYADDVYQAPSTSKMAALLQKTLREQDWKTDSYKEDERAEYYRSLSKEHPDLAAELKIRQTLAESLLRAGDSGGAIEQLETVRKLCTQHEVKLDHDAERNLRNTLAISYLRLGEQQNCLLIHGREACIFPIHGSGVHARMEGSEGAFRELSAALEVQSQRFEIAVAAQHRGYDHGTLSFGRPAEISGSAGSLQVRLRRWALS